jgi:hypothetical protein
MNFNIDQRLQNTINRIEARASQPHQPPPAQVVIHKSTIPRTPHYYMQKANEARDNNEPYLRSVYLRARALAFENKHREINRLLHIANETIQRKRNPAPAPARRIRRSNNKRYHLRSVRRPHQELYRVRNVNQYIVDYSQKVKHKKSILYDFLRRMYEANMRYIASSRKFAFNKENHRRNRRG